MQYRNWMYTKVQPAFPAPNDATSLGKDSQRCSCTHPSVTPYLCLFGVQTSNQPCELYSLKIQQTDTQHSLCKQSIFHVSGNFAFAAVKAPLKPDLHFPGNVATCCANNGQFLLCISSYVSLQFVLFISERISINTLV